MVRRRNPSGTHRPRPPRFHLPATPVREIGAKAVSLTGIFAVLTFLFGLVAFLIGGGFGAYGPEYHTSLLFMLVLVGIQFFVIRPAWGTLSADGDEEPRQAAHKRFAMSIGAGHLIWLFVLVLMPGRNATR